MLHYLQVAASAIAAVVVLLLFVRRRRSKLPPSPPGRLPITGHLHLLKSFRLPHHDLHRISTHHSWPLFSLQLGLQTFIVASTPEAAQHVLRTHDLAFAARPTTTVARRLHHCADILFGSPADPRWNFLRQLCSAQLFSKKRLDAFLPVRSAEMRSALCSVLDSAGTPIAIRAVAHSLTANIMSRMAFGKRLPDLAPLSQAHGSLTIIELTEQMNRLLGVINFDDFFPILAKLDVHGYGRQASGVAKKFDLFFQEIIDNHYEELRHADSIEKQTEKSQSFLGLLLQAASESDGPSKISHQNVKGVLMIVFGGGVGTTAITIEWAFGELLANPMKMRKLQEELEQVVGMERLVEESDLSNLPFLEAVVKETMRLHPVVPLLVPHMANKSCEVMGYHIPANTRLHVNVWGIGRDPNTWENPLEFRPERFLGEHIDISGKHFGLLPFGSGRRGCPGWMLGLVMVQLAVASLVQAFEWEATKELNISDDYGLLISFKDPLVVCASPKLPAHLYQSSSVQGNL